MVETTQFNQQQSPPVSALELDKIGIHYIEGGWPGSNPKDMELFKAVFLEIVIL